MIRQTGGSEFRRNLHQVQALIPRIFQRVLDGQDPDLVTVGSDYPDLHDGDLVVASNTLRLNDSLCSL